MKQSAVETYIHNVLKFLHHPKWIAFESLRAKLCILINATVSSVWYVIKAWFSLCKAYETVWQSTDTKSNFIRFPAVQKFWKSIKIWQNYRKFKGGSFFWDTVYVYKTVEVISPNIYYKFSVYYSNHKNWHKCFAYASHRLLEILTKLAHTYEVLMWLYWLICKENSSVSLSLQMQTYTGCAKTTGNVFP